MGRWFFFFGAFALVGGCDLSGLFDSAKDSVDSDDDDGDGEGEGNNETFGNETNGGTNNNNNNGGSVAECEDGMSVFCDCLPYIKDGGYCTQSGFDQLVADCVNGSVYTDYILCLSDYQPVGDFDDCIDAFDDCGYGGGYTGGYDTGYYYPNKP